MAMLEKAKSDEKDKKKHKKPPSEKAAPEPQPDESDADESASAPDTGGDEPDADDSDSSGSAPQAQGADGDQDDSDAGAPQAGGGDQGQQGGAPVPSPAAPGAGDTTTGGADTPDQGPTPPPAETPGPDEQAPGTADMAGAPEGAGKDLPQVPMSPALQEEYEILNKRLYELLYGQGSNIAHHILEALTPQGPTKIKGAAMMSLLLMKDIVVKNKPPMGLVLPFTKNVVAHVLELGEQVKQIQYNSHEAAAIFGAAYEGALRMFGVKKSQLNSFRMRAGITRSQFMQHHQNYLAAHKHAQAGINANNQAAGPVGAPQQAGPQSGAPAGTQATPQQGAAPQQPPPQGGMLAQAAAASPAAQGEQNG